MLHCGLRSLEYGKDGMIGIRFPNPSKEYVGGGGGKGVSSPWGASGGTCPRCGYLCTRMSLTGKVRHKKHSSIDAFSVDPSV